MERDVGAVLFIKVIYFGSRPQLPVKCDVVLEVFKDVHDLPLFGDRVLYCLSLFFASDVFDTPLRLDRNPNPTPSYQDCDWRHDGWRLYDPLGRSGRHGGKGEKGSLLGPGLRA